MRPFELLPIFICAAVLLTANLPALAAADTPLNVCTTQNPAFTTDDLSGIEAPCAAAPGSVLVEMLYFQNASRVGGTALAAYPLFRVRAGIVHHLEAVIDTPSQIAESGLGGIGLYPTTHIGYGLNYTLNSDARMASSLGVELLPPSSRFTVDESQPRYIIDLTAGFQLNRRTTLSAIATGTSSHTVGFERVSPAAAVRVAFDASTRTQISTDFGARVVARRSVAQSYGDVAVNERLRKYLTFAVGLGTTFNPVSNAKAHYLASGFNFHLK
jgi:hypothetical protein